MSRLDAAPVLVTGGAGFIGHHVVARLLAKGCPEVRVLDDLSTGSRSLLPADPRVRLMEGSVLDLPLVRQAGRGVGAVFHLASKVGMEVAARDPAGTWTVSVDGTATVLDGTADVPFVTFSSSAVYGLTATDRPVTEQDADGSEGPLAYDGGAPGYATGKWDMEQRVLAAGRSGRPVLIVRPFNVVGEGQTPAYGMVVPRFIRRALAGKPLVIYDDGLQRRSFSDVKVMLDYLFLLLEAPAAWDRDGCVFNIGSPHMTTIRDLAGLVCAETGAQVPVDFVPYKDVFPKKTDVRCRIPDTAHLQRVAGTLTWPGVDEVVRRLVALEKAGDSAEVRA